MAFPAAVPLSTVATSGVINSFSRYPPRRLRRRWKDERRRKALISQYPVTRNSYEILTREVSVVGWNSARKRIREERTTRRGQTETKSSPTHSPGSNCQSTENNYNKPRGISNEPLRGSPPEGLGFRKLIALNTTSSFRVSL